MPTWRTVVAGRLKQFREEAHGGSGITHQDVADRIGRTKSYVVKLETELEKQNPTLKILDELCSLYGREVAELFEPLIPYRGEWRHTELHEKLDAILTKGSERRKIGISVNIEAMYYVEFRLPKPKK